MQPFRDMPVCSLVYVDIGSNRGDSILNFISNNPQAHVLRALKAADRGWLPNTSCVFGFEPNPEWTHRLKHIQRSNRQNVLYLEIQTETAIVHDDKKYVQLSIDPNFPHSETASIANKVGTRSANVSAVNIVEWLRAKSLVFKQQPIVMRMDIEGSEYNVLRSLATFGQELSKRNRIIVAVEWHRHRKHTSLPVDVRNKMLELDDSFKWVRGGQNKLEDTLEKQLVFWLSQAGVELF